MGVFSLAIAIFAGEASIEVGLGFPANIGVQGYAGLRGASGAASGIWFYGGGRSGVFFIWCLNINAPKRQSVIRF